MFLVVLGRPWVPPWGRPEVPGWVPGAPGGVLYSPGCFVTPPCGAPGAPRGSRCPAGAPGVFLGRQIIDRNIDRTRLWSLSIFLSIFRRSLGGLWAAMGCFWVAWCSLGGPACGPVGGFFIRASPASMGFSRLWTVESFLVRAAGIGAIDPSCIKRRVGKEVPSFSANLFDPRRRYDSRLQEDKYMPSHHKETGLGNSS